MPERIADSPYLRPKCYPLFVAVRECSVSYEDTRGVVHTVRVHASGVYEAAALGVIEFKRCEFLKEQPGAGTLLTIAVPGPTIVHELTVTKLEAWLNSTSKGGQELIEKTRLKKQLDKL